MTRCLATLWLTPHELVMTRKRDAEGALVTPATLVWQCLRCGRAVGETVLWPPGAPPVIPAPGRLRQLLGWPR